MESNTIVYLCGLLQNIIEYDPFVIVNQNKIHTEPILNVLRLIL